jgi:hypothetical protein
MADIYGTLTAILDAVAGQLADPPDRRYVSAAQPAADCEQLTVHLGPITRGTSRASRPDHPCAPDTLTAIITRFWCVSGPDEDGSPPAAGTLDGEGAVYSDGAHELWRAVAAAAASVACHPSLEEGAPINQTGGVVGFAVAVRFTP